MRATDPPTHPFLGGEGAKARVQHGYGSLVLLSKALSHQAGGVWLPAGKLTTNYFRRNKPTGHQNRNLYKAKCGSILAV